MKNVVFSYTRLSVSYLLPRLGTSEGGLASKDAEARLIAHGKNELASQKTTALAVFLRQFKSPFVYLLIAAAILSFILGETTDSLFIIVFITINSVLGFYQEYQSEQTVALLKKLIDARVTVVRDGKNTLIPASDLVPGDIVILSPGDIAQADLRFIDVKNFTVDESILTGESEAQAKTASEITTKVTELYEATNCMFAGTTAIGGWAKAVVVATGHDKVISQIAEKTVNTNRESTFEKGISSFSRLILKIVGVTIILMIVANLLVKGADSNLPELLLFSIALSVSVIPEALPVVTTFSLSQGARKLAQKKVIVKRLSAIEDLGSISVLCTDKTGTITQNNMILTSRISYKGADVFWWAALGSDFVGNKVHLQELNSFDAGLYPKIGDEIHEKLKKVNRMSELPFDPVRRRTTVVVSDNKDLYLVSRGAPENILELCGTVQKREEIEKWITKEGLTGHRIMAIAYKKLVKDTKDLSKAEKDLTFVGLLSYDDPLKPSTHLAMQKATELGVQIKIITGDRPEVAGAVATEIGLISNPHDVITGAQFMAMNEEEKDDVVLAHHVFARVAPLQKYEIVKRLQSHFEVGFLGEGINDAPALKVANVGIVVASGSDISKDAGDIILLNQSLLTIVEGIEGGRKVFANTVKYIKATLTSNFGNFYAVAISSLFIPFLPMLPIQILLVNMLSDFPMISIATDKVDAEELTSPKQYDIKDVAVSSTILGLVSTCFDFLTFALFFRLAPSVLQTNWFMESILTELVLIYSIRSKRSMFKAGRPSKTILFLTIVAALVTVVVPFTSFGHKTFSFVTPTLAHVLTIIAIVVCYLITTEIAKVALFKVRRLSAK